MFFSQTQTPNTMPILSHFKHMVRRPSRLQIAALCYRMDKDEPQVLLVTSRSTRRLILPKGWPIMKSRAHKTARTEAYEEAGVLGKVSKKPYGRFRSYKGHKAGLKLRTDVLVYLIEVKRQLEDFPEKGQRDLLWLSIPEAIKKADEPGLARLLSQLQHEMAH